MSQLAAVCDGRGYSILLRRKLFAESFHRSLLLLLGDHGKLNFVPGRSKACVVNENTRG